MHEFSFLEDATGTELLKQKLNERRCPIVQSTRFVLSFFFSCLTGSEEKLLGDSRHVPLSNRDFADSGGQKKENKFKKLATNKLTEPPPRMMLLFLLPTDSIQVTNGSDCDEETHFWQFGVL